MEAHTPKREAVEKFIKGHGALPAGWSVRVVDQQETPVIRLEAVKVGEGAGEGPKNLEIHSRQIMLTSDKIDDSTKKLISRWLDALPSASHRAQA